MSRYEISRLREEVDKANKKLDAIVRCLRRLAESYEDVTGYKQDMMQDIHERRSRYE